ncbi:uncharacterized protein LOC144440974 isoform X3 [Glandiceps talaboti]
MGSRVRENPDRILECLVEVSAPKDRTSDPTIISIYPEDFGDERELKEITHFCFPYDTSSSYSPAGQLFTFVLTDIESRYRFGFCRHPPGAQTCLCILSYLPWFEIFYRFLNTLGEMKAKRQENDSMVLVEALYGYPVPEALTEVTIKTQIEGTGLSSNTVSRQVVYNNFSFVTPDPTALPTIPESRNVTEYYNAVDTHNMMLIFASLLYERRVLVTSKKLSLLTAIIHGAATLLYPLYWQQIFIPVIPPKLLDYCCAPMPFLIGVHASLMDQVRKKVSDQMMEIVILDADNNTVETPFDDFESLPSEINEKMKSRMKKTERLLNDGVARIFLKALVPLLGGYRNALKLRLGEKITFDDETYVQAKSSSMRRILEKMMTFQHFQQFIDGRLDMLNSGKGFSDVFEEECDLAEQDKDKLKNKYTHWMKDGKNLINKTKEKMKAMSNRFSHPKAKEVEDIPTSSTRMPSLQYLDIPEGVTQKSAPTSPTRVRTTPPQRPPPPRPPPFEVYNAAFTRDRTAAVTGVNRPSPRSSGTKEPVKRYNPMFVPGDDAGGSNNQSEQSSSSNGEDIGQQGNWNLMSDFDGIFSKFDKGLLNTSSDSSEFSFQRGQTRHSMPVSVSSPRQFQRSSRGAFNALTSTNPPQGLPNTKDDDRSESAIGNQRKEWETFDDMPSPVPSPVPPSRTKRNYSEREKSLTASDTQLSVSGKRKEGPPVPPRPASVSLQRRIGSPSIPQKYANMRKSVVKIQVTATSPTDSVESRPPPPASLIDAPIPTSFSSPSLVEKDPELSPVTKEFSSQQELLADYGLDLGNWKSSTLTRQSDSSNNNPGFSTPQQPLTRNNLPDLLTSNTPHTASGVSTILHPSAAASTEINNSKTRKEDPFADLVSLTKASVTQEKPLDMKKANSFGSFGQ